MIRNTILFFALFLVTSVASAQNWIDQGPFPDSTTFWRSGHGIAVDADNKIWLSMYYPDTSIPVVINGDTVTVVDGATSALRTSSLHVFNADGTKAMEPMHSFTFNGTTDTLAYDTATSRNPSGIAKRITGVKADHNGNIIVMVGQSASLMFRINHDTGEVMNRIDLSSDSFTESPASPGIDEDGNIYVAAVSANHPISIFNSDFIWQGNVWLSSPGIGRNVEVSADGNSVYWSAFTHSGVYKFHRKDEFSPYDSLGLILDGLVSESSTRHPQTGQIWFGNAQGGAIIPDTTKWSLLTWYALDPSNDEIVDSLHYNLPFMPISSRKTRGFAFSTDGIYAYASLFDGDFVDGVLYNGGDNPQNLPYKKFMRGQVTSIDRDPVEIPDGFTLSQNYPNPFNPQTRIEFEIRDAGLASLKVYDLLGREVATLVDEHLVAGKYTATFNASNLPSGSYVYQLDVAGNRLSGKMTLVK